MMTTTTTTTAAGKRQIVLVYPSDVEWDRSKLARTDAFESPSQKRIRASRMDGWMDVAPHSGGRLGQGRVLLGGDIFQPVFFGHHF